MTSSVIINVVYLSLLIVLNLITNRALTIILTPLLISTSYQEQYNSHLLLLIYLFNLCLFLYSYMNILKPISSDPYIFHPFLSADDIQYEYLSEFVPIQAKLHWLPYILSISPFNKNVVIVMEIGYVISESHLVTFKNIVKHLPDVASQRDQYYIVVSYDDVIISSCSSKEKEWNPSLNIEDFIEQILYIISHIYSFYDFCCDILGELAEAPRTMQFLANAILKSNIPIKLNVIIVRNGKLIISDVIVLSSSSFRVSRLKFCIF
uniref:Uncharacterized protein n=1 Tax=Heterorhabditis bacteriophora TaxID=37862 RepID=A0A1I7WZM0_HETBA